MSKKHLVDSMLSVEEVARYLNVCNESIYRWTRSKGLPGHRIGKILRYDIKEVDRWVRNSKKEVSQ